jgi:hypothetical protein
MNFSTKGQRRSGNDVFELYQQFSLTISYFLDKLPPRVG